MTEKKKSASKDVKFEKGIEKLEAIVDSLENGDASLEDAIKQYEEGVKLSSLLNQKLQEAEKKIEVLNRSLSGSLRAEPFEVEEGGGRRKKAVSDDEETLF